MNGYIKNLLPGKLYSEFKLTSTSYQRDDFIKSDWLDMFRNDCSNAKAIFFVGFSLEYDLDIKRAIVQNDNFKDKCIFICHSNEKESNKYKMNKYGRVCTIGVKGFRDEVKKILNVYNPVDYEDNSLQCFEYYNNKEFLYKKIRDKDVLDLLLLGNIDISHVNNFSPLKKYLVRRNKFNKVLEVFDKNIKVVIIESDLGNGKTCLLHDLMSELKLQGDVYILNQYTDLITSDIEKILVNSGKKYIVIEDYNLYLEALGKFKFYNLDDIYFIITARSYINDAMYLNLCDAVRFKEEEIVSLDINILEDSEIIELVEIFDEYHLWGKNAGLKKHQKINLIKRECKRKFQNDYEAAKLFFDNARAYGKKKIITFDSYQLDTHYARYLLEYQIYKNQYENSFGVFLEAHRLIYNNKNEKTRWHYPLKQAGIYFDYYKKFYNYFSDVEKAKFIICCHEILEKISVYNMERTRLEKNTNYQVMIVERKIKKIVFEVNKGLTPTELVNPSQVVRQKI